MSVPKGQRSKSKLEVQVACEELVTHTVRIIGNPKHFKPENAKLHERILDTAIGVGQDAWEANGIYVKTAEDYRMRRKVRRLMKREQGGLSPPGTARESYMGWRAHAEKGDSRLLLERCDRWFKFLEGETR